MISSDQAQLLESPCSMIVATVDDGGLPDATRGWSIEILPDGRIRLLLSTTATVTLENLHANGRIAVTGTHFASLVSVQVKGVVETIEGATAPDRIRFDRFCAGCVHAIHELDGTPEELVWRLAPPDVVACVLRVAEVYDQTPGPGAGARVAPAGV